MRRRYPGNERGYIAVYQNRRRVLPKSSSVGALVCATSRVLCPMFASRKGSKPRTHACRCHSGRRDAECFERRHSLIKSDGPSREEDWCRRVSLRDTACHHKARRLVYASRPIPAEGTSYVAFILTYLVLRQRDPTRDRRLKRLQMMLEELDAVQKVGGVSVRREGNGSSRASRFGYRCCP